MGDSSNADKAKNQQQWNCSEEYREMENKKKFNSVTAKYQCEMKWNWDVKIFCYTSISGHFAELST